MQPFPNPFRPGAGHKPPYLAGRQEEQLVFLELLKQEPVMQNLIITGRRGVGKTSLLEELKTLAINQGWFWAGTDLSESASISERNLCTRIITDISGITSAFQVTQTEKKNAGFVIEDQLINSVSGNYQFLMQIYESAPGLESDKLKAVLEAAWNIVKGKAKGIVIAYDEAQTLRDQHGDKQYPLSLLLEVISYFQRKQIPYLIVLAGLPTLQPNLVETRTYAERMFRVLTLDRLNAEESKEAITYPIKSDNCPVCFSENSVETIYENSGGYPYFIQFFCKEFFDIYLQQIRVGIEKPVVYLNELILKLDSDFYAGRWQRVSDRQKDLMKIISHLDGAENEFTVQDIVEKSKTMFENSFSASNVNQMLVKLEESGLVFKKMYGKYALAVPLLSSFIKRQQT